MTPGDGPKSAGEMMSDIMGNIGNLVRNEADLARAEVAGSLNNIVAALGMLAVALVVAVAGLNLLAAALVGLVIWAGVSPPLATVVVGAGLLLVAIAIFVAAKSTLNNVGVMPKRAARSVRRDVAAIKDAYNDK